VSCCWSRRWLRGAREERGFSQERERGRDRASEGARGAAAAGGGGHTPLPKWQGKKRRRLLARPRRDGRRGRHPEARAHNVPHGAFARIDRAPGARRARGAAATSSCLPKIASVSCRALYLVARPFSIRVGCAPAGRSATRRWLRTGRGALATRPLRQLVSAAICSAPPGLAPLFLLFSSLVKLDCGRFGRVVCESPRVGFRLLRLGIGVRGEPKSEGRDGQGGGTAEMSRRRLRQKRGVHHAPQSAHTHTHNPHTHTQQRNARTDNQASREPKAINSNNRHRGGQWM